MERAAHLSTVAAAAEYLGIDEHDVQEAIEAGLLRAVPPSGDTRIHNADLEAFMERARPGSVTARFIPFPRRRENSSGSQEQGLWTADNTY